MQILIITVGENKFPFFKKGESMYTERLSHYAKMSMISVRADKLSVSVPAARILKTEAARISKVIPEGFRTIVLDIQGEMMSSEDLSKQIGAWQNRGWSRLCFCIGGPHGLDPDFVHNADFRLSLSPMTFPHDLVRLIFLEQLYRAMTLLKGEKYHK
ncbi:23S rRNA (pseudouridine(1915)-N(3))-methyltransferase RlmH [bacterium]|nr:23S rRNA (pseudouridine(1915)-N(3))-methyltransferase RlmH [bacterium]